MSESPTISCAECGGVMAKAIGASQVSPMVVGMTPSKAWKEKVVRAKSEAKREVRKLERWSNLSRAIPNFKGQEVGSWAEAKKLAQDAGGDTSRYDAYIQKEKNTKNSAGVDESRWKAAKEKAKRT